jgi:hypothetical protein
VNARWTMATTQTKTETTLRNMLYLTDFSGASEAALSSAISEHAKARNSRKQIIPFVFISRTV